MELSVVGSAQVLSVSDAVFGREFNRDLVHQVVVAFRNAGRAGTKAQLSRAEVSGTTKKFKKQKGGGARHGDYRAPIFIGGGVTFAAKPRSFEQKVNRKMYRGAIAALLSELARLERLTVVESFALEAPKTKMLAARLKELGYVVVGVSPDSVASHERFQSKYELTHLMASDPSKALCEAFGVWREKKNYGKTYLGLVRSTFVVSAEGVIQHAQYNVKATGHVERLMKLLDVEG